MPATGAPGSGKAAAAGSEMSTGPKTKAGRARMAFLWTTEGEATMNLPRRRFLHVAAGAAVLPAMSRVVS
jgi:hypothetical protein